MAWECACGISNTNPSKCAGCGWSKEESDKYNNEQKQLNISKLPEIPRVPGAKEYIMLAPAEGYQRTFDGEALQYMLNKYASEGWRLISATPMAGLKPMKVGVGEVLGALFLSPLITGAIKYAEEQTWTMVFILERDIK